MNKISLLFVCLILFAVTGIMAQPFSLMNTSITGVGRPAVAWGDYDNDGDLDLFLGGMTNSGSFLSRIYNNEDGTFVADDNVFHGVKDGSAMWGDFDNDNDLDILLSGETEENGNITLIYRNNEGVFEELDSGLPGVGYGDAAWGDYDNDGDLDILVAGNWVVALYENIDGLFTETENDFGNLQNAKICWGDFDNDGDLDILLIGDTGGGYFADVYLNEDGVYSRANLEMEGVLSGTADMVDFDNDGDLDISITGFNLFLDPCYFLYENLGDGTIGPYFNFMEGIAQSAVDFGDYDNDGDLDVIMAGKNAACGSSIAKVYNNDAGTYTMENAAIMDGAIRCNAAWADIDNDGDLDYLLSGMTLSETPFSRLYKNEAGSNEYAVNTMPEAPGGLDAVVDHQSVTFSWQKASDEQTPQDGLSYNIRLGVHAGEHELIGPMADAESGYRFVQAIGNANQQTSWTISKLEQGTYYWSVQSIDQAHCGSAFAQEGSFVILETGIGDLEEGIISSIYPNPAKDMIHINTKEQGNFEISILNTYGQVLLSGIMSSGDAVDISDLKQGVYFLKLTDGSKVSVQRVVKK